MFIFKVLRQIETGRTAPYFLKGAVRGTANEQIVCLAKWATE